MGKPGGKQKTYHWTGRNGKVSWDRELCIHVGECTRAGDLFESGRDPWCKPDADSADGLADVVARCPTGSLFLVRGDGEPAEMPEPQNTVTVANNGPLYVRGDLQFENPPADKPGIRMRAALCRCGQSNNKPFCDNAHEDAVFRDRGAIGETGSGKVEEKAPLEIKCAANGPLLLNGPFTILAASGRRAWCGTKAALCRCGHSENKPFCDGAHKNAGFKAE